MGLKAKLTNDEYDKLPDALRSAYVKSGDGYILDAEGVEDVGALKTAIQREREARAKAEKDAKETLAKFADLDPEAARSALKRLDDIENKTLLDAGKVDEVVAKRTEAMRRDYDNRLAAAQKALDEGAQLVEKMTRRLETLTIDSALKDVAIKAGVRDTALPDLLSRGRSVFKMQGDQVVPLNEDGTTRMGKSGRDPLTFDEYVVGLQSDAPHLFEPSRGTGSTSVTSDARRGSGPVVFRVPAEGPVRLADFEAAQETAKKNNAALAIERN